MSRKDIEMYSRETHQIVYERLMELANGVEPISTNCGICYDLDNSVNINYFFSGYLYCSCLFKEMGLPKHFPIGYDEPLWEGENGVKRRKLARDMAEFIKRKYLE